MVTKLVARQFRLSVVHPAFGLARPFAPLVLMPEAPVHEDRLPSAHERDVWSAGEILSVKAVAVSCLPEELPNDKLGLCVF